MDMQNVAWDSLLQLPKPDCWQFSFCIELFYFLSPSNSWKHFHLHYVYCASLYFLSIDFPIDIICLLFFCTEPSYFTFCTCHQIHCMFLSFNLFRLSALNYPASVHMLLNSWSNFRYFIHFFIFFSVSSTASLSQQTHL